jgi:hypothetical protein
MFFKIKIKYNDIIIMTIPYAKQQPPPINQLPNVNISESLADGEVLKYNEATEEWINGIGASTGTANLGDVIIGDGAGGITSTDKLFVDTLNSRVGIGTTTPTSKLDVRDTMRVSGDINFGSPLNNVTLSSIAYDNGTGGIDVKSYANLGLYTAGSERIRVASGGSVGIGTTAPTNTLNVKGGLVPLKVEPTGSSTDGVNLTLGYTGLTFNTTAPAYKTFAITNSLTGDALGLMNFNNGGSTRMTIANAGNVGIGTTHQHLNYILKNHQLSGSAGINVQKTGTVVSSGNSYGVLSQTTGASTTNYGGFFTASGGTNNYGLVVSAGNVGVWNTAPAYQLQVGTSSGEIAIGGTPTTNSSGRLKFINSNSVTNWQISTNDSTSSAFEIMPSTVPGGSTFTTPAMKISGAGAVTIANLGSGTVQATAGVLSIVSDARLKDEDGFITDALTKVLQLKPRYFKWKTDNLAGLPDNVRQLGFFAQEVQDVLGEEVVNTPSEGGNYGIHDRGIIAMLVKSIQEQQVIIDLLDNRLKLIETK